MRIDEVTSVSANELTRLFWWDKKGSAPGRMQSLCDLVGSEQGQQDEVQDEQSGADPQDGVDLLDLAAADLHDAVEDEAGSDAIGDRVAQRHEDAGEESGYSLIQLGPVDILEGGSHHDADHDQSGRGRRVGHCADEGGQEGRQATSSLRTR